MMRGKYLYIIAAALFLLFLTFTSKSPVNALTAYESNLYWDRGDVLYKGVVNAKPTISCALEQDLGHYWGADWAPIYSGEQGRVNRHIAHSNLRRCLLNNQDIPDDVRAELDSKMTDENFRFGSFITSYRINPSEDIKLKAVDCTIDMKVFGDGDKIDCEITYKTKFSETLYSAGFKNGEIIFATSDGKRKIFVNGIVQNSSGYEQFDSSGAHEEGFPDSNIAGNASLSWQENYVYSELEKQYNDLAEEYFENCMNRIGGDRVNQHDCRPDVSLGVSNNMNASGAFAQIWRNCVVAGGGSVEADIENSANCLEEHTGARPDISEILENAPPDPSLYEDNKNCGITTAGYIICPVMRFLASAAEKTFSLIKGLLHIHALNPSQTNGQNAKKAWIIFSNIANIIFAILLLSIILSQLTGIGIDNYGIKRLLPRLIVGAILVNSSFYLCIAAIDVSNILGDSLQKVMLAINNDITPVSSGQMVLSASMDGVNSSAIGGWEKITNGILAASVLAGGVAAVAAVIFAFVPIMTAVVLSAVTTTVTLLVRYGLVLLLTVVSPIAFALYLLPNTRKWFEKWRTTFISLLILYPILSVLFGLSTLAANIVMQVASATSGQMLAVFALAIQAIPLAVTPIILKSSGQTLGNIGNSIQNNRLFSGVRSFAKNSQSGINKKAKARALRGKYVPFGGAIRFMEKRKLKSRLRKTTAKQMEANYVSDYMNSVEGSGGDKVGILEKSKGLFNNNYQPKTAGEKMINDMASVGGKGAKDRALAFAVSSQHEIMTDEIKAQKLSLEGKNNDELVSEIKANTSSSADGGIDAAKMARVEKIIDSSDGDSIRAVVEVSGINMSDMELALLNTVADKKNSIFISNPNAQQAILSRQVRDRSTFNKHVVESTVMSDTFSASTVRDMSSDDIKILFDGYDSGDFSTEDSQKVKHVASQVIQNNKITNKLNDSELQKFKSIADARA
ncbi:type IV secretion system protein [Candidatus Saccharibacteria bacterium]|nr:type IV secretion system protein [Candidatus Saccharibacteria bacterium]